MNGYKVIDFKGADITDTPTIEGIFDAIDKSDKPLIFTNIADVDTFHFKSYFVSLCTKASTGPTTYAYLVNSPIISEGQAVNMLINDDDTVTIPD